MTTDRTSPSEPQTFRELFVEQPHILRVLRAIGYSEADLDDRDEFERSVNLARTLVPGAFRDAQ